MTPRGGPTLDFSLFGRYFLDLAVFYRGIPLPRALWEHVEGPPAHRCAGSHSRHGHLPCIGGLCAIFELDSNILLLPTCWRRSGCCAGGWGRKFP